MKAERFFADKWLDLETKINYQFINQISFTERVHCHDFFEIFLITSGSALHHVNNTIQILSEGSMVFIRPDDIHFYEKHELTDCQFINLAFTRDYVYDLFNYLNEADYAEKLLPGSIPPVVYLSQSDKNNAQSKLENLALIPSNNKNLIRTHLKTLLVDFMTNNFSIYNIDNRLMPPWLELLLYEIKKKENFKEGVHILEKLSKKSPEYISRNFKEYLGKTPTELINELRLEYTANMLIHSDVSILDIAYEAGFNNISHFYHLFNKKYHTSPNKVRKNGQKILVF